MKILTNVAAIATLVTAAFGFSPLVHAQDFPSQTIKILVGVAPGGIPDLVSRRVAQTMTTDFGQTAVVENRVGAGGLVAAREVIRSAADGHTLLAMDISLWAIIPTLQAKTSYDPLKDLSPVGLAVTSPVLLLVNKKLNVKTMQEFVALAKAKPKSLTYSTNGVGSVQHLFMEAAKNHFGLEIVHAPYNGGAQAVRAVVAGEVEVAIASPSSSAAMMASGELVPILQSTRKRSPLLPDVLSLDDVGMTDYDFAGDFGIAAPAGTPKAVIDKLSMALAKTVEAPEFASFAKIAFMEKAYRSPEQLLETMKADVPRYARAIRLAGIKTE